MKNTDGLDMNQFKFLPEISHYNSGYYLGFGRDLLFAKSDDDNTTEWWLIKGNKSIYIGESYCTNDNKLVRYDKQNT